MYRERTSVVVAARASVFRNTMILPTSYAAALVLGIITIICWGSWANTFKLSKNWRFELFYFDFSFGVLLTAITAALTFGSMGDELSFHDNLLIAGKRNMGLAFVAGVVFNLANLLLVAAISVAGLAVAFPIAIGLALVIGLLWSYGSSFQGNPLFLFSGAALVVAAVLVDALAYRMHNARSGRSKSSVKGLVLCIVSGVLMGCFYPLVELSKASEIGLGPYTIAFFFSIGVFLSTFVFNIYFMNLPVQGEPVGLAEYLRPRSLGNHLLGLAGGALWCTGAIAHFAASSAPPEAGMGPSLTYATAQGATIVSVLWGLLVWHEFRGALPRVKMMLTAMMALFAAGLALVSVAPLFKT